MNTAFQTWYNNMMPPRGPAPYCELLFADQPIGTVPDVEVPTVIREYVTLPFLQPENRQITVQIERISANMWDGTIFNAE